MILLSVMMSNENHTKRMMTKLYLLNCLVYFMNYTVDILSVISHVIITGVTLVKSSISFSIIASIEW